MAKQRRESRRTESIIRDLTAPPESLLISALDDLSGRRVLCTSLGRAQFATAIAERLPESNVVCHFLDVFLAQQSRELIGQSRPNLQILCEPDLPAGEYELVALPFWKRGEAELTRELLQQGHQRLCAGGRLLATTDNPRDAWLHDQLRALFDKVTRRPAARGVLYSATKTTPLKRPRDFTSEFAFRDGERLIKAITRPGVFSHRELDVGARALLEATASPEQFVQPGLRILDLGCGAGTVGIALASRAAGVHLHAVDSNPRAIQCTVRSAELNGLRVTSSVPRPKSGPLTSPDSQLSTISIQLDAEGRVPQPGSFDVVVANPPYYSNWRIATIFVETAERALKPGGRLFLVTKHAEWYSINVPFVLSEVQVRSIRDYFVVTARQRRQGSSPSSE